MRERVPMSSVADRNGNEPDGESCPAYFLATHVPIMRGGLCSDNVGDERGRRGTAGMFR